MTARRKISVSSTAYPLKKAHLQTDAYYGMALTRLRSGLVISRTIDGSVISTFDDDQWLLPAFAFSVRDNPYFDFLPFREEARFNAENVVTCKRIFSMKMFSTKSKTGKAMRLTTIQTIMAALYHANSFSNKRNIEIQKIFGSKKLFEEMLKSIPISYSRPLLSLLRTLANIDSNNRGFPIDGTIIPFLAKINRESRSKFAQHPVIPSRILWAKYKQYRNCLHDYLKYKDAIHNFIEKTIDDRFFGRCEVTRYKYRKEYTELPLETKQAYDQEPITFWKSLEKYNLTPLAQKYNWKATRCAIQFLSLVQYCAKCLVHLFTLMRDSEAYNLPVDCLESIRGWNDEALYVCGISTKLESEKTDAKWITTDEILQPIQILQSIQRFVASHAEDNTETNWLFLAASNLPFSGSSKKDGVAATNLDHNLPPVIITEADIRELETIDPYRNWRDDKRFKVGQPWRVTTHQFRRSIAVFAGQSGLITLPSLKRLLRHITKAMSTYYMKGCSAKNYLFTDINPKLTLELKRAKQEADAAVFIRDVLKSAEQMYGFAGRRAMEMREQSPWLAGTVEDTKQQVKLGLTAYQETPAGGCTSPLPCDKRAHAKMDTCSTCKNFVGQESKMAETIEIMEFDLAELKPGTIEYRAELQNLEDFKAFRDRVIARG